MVHATREQGRQVANLREAFKVSNLPFRVDLFVWDAVPEQFRQQIENEYVVLVKAGATGRRGRIGSGEWREVRWGDLATLEYGRALRGYGSAQGPVRVFGTNGPIGWHDEALCRHPGVVVGRKGAYRGIHYSPQPFFIIDTAFYLKPKVELDVRWAYYELLTQDINGMDSGSAIPSTSREEFYDLPVLVPPPPEQRAIAHVLGTLDDKIELNRRMNETLEAMARALFKSWFADFDPVRAKMEGRDTGLPPDIADLFPDRLINSEMGEIPEGWAVFRLAELADHHTKSMAPSASPETEYEHFSIPAYDADRMPAIEQGGAIRSNKIVVPRNAVLLSKLNPEVPRVWMPPYAPNASLQICSTEFLVLTPKYPANRSLLYSLFVDAAFRTTLRSLVTGTSKSHQRVPPKALKQIDVLSGTPALFEQFDGLATIVLTRIIQNRSESSTLAALRDSVLPRLLSGVLHVRGVGQFERAT